MKLNHYDGYTSNCFEWLYAVSPLVCLVPTNCQGDSSQCEYAVSMGAQWYAAGYDGVVLMSMDNAENISVKSQLDSTLREVFGGTVIKAKEEAKPVTLESITLTSPTKTKYVVGESVDLDGLAVSGIDSEDTEQIFFNMP